MTRHLPLQARASGGGDDDDDQGAGSSGRGAQAEEEDRALTALLASGIPPSLESRLSALAARHRALEAQMTSGEIGGGGAADARALMKEYAGLQGVAEVYGQLLGARKQVRSAACGVCV